MKVWKLWILACVLALACARKETTTETSATATPTPSAPTSTAPSTQISIQQKDPFGEYLVDGKGQSVYIFTKDQSGSDTSACTEKCAEEWPPVTTVGEAEPIGGVQTTLIDTITRSDGTRQVTYNGWPLYYYKKDTSAGETHGEKAKEFGGEWYLVSSEGEKVEGGSRD